MSKYTVTKYLNVRVGKPSLSAPCFQYLAPGSELETDGKLYKGDRFEGSDDWLKDEAGNYYWKGGVATSEAPPLPPDYWYHLLGIDTVRRDFDERGARARVLVLDTGINDDLPVFNGAVLKKINFAEGAPDLRSNDPICHGTHCAGLIAARSGDQSIGIAPEAGLLIGKITDNGLLQNGDTMRQALKIFLAPEYDFDVISISANIGYTEDLELKSLISKHLEKNRIVVASIGNDPSKKNQNHHFYPGFFDECISVGACESDQTVWPGTAAPAKADIFCYGTHIGSYQRSAVPQPLCGTSQATAIVAGICALLISYLKRKNIPYDPIRIKNLITANSEPLGAFNARLIQPTRLFQSLNTV